MESRYIVNDSSTLATPDDPVHHMKQALEHITRRGPKSSYTPQDLSGLWAGPTGMAYLFLHVAAIYPTLEINGCDALVWAKRYMAGERGLLRLGSDRCGIGCEILAYHALQACLSKDIDHVQEFIALVDQVVSGKEYPDELLQGRAGTLYMLRMIRHWVPSSRPLVEQRIQAVTDAILANGLDWKWRGKRYLGAVHGDIGILTQLILTTPVLAPRLEGKLIQLLDMQLSNGNWPNSAEMPVSSLFQFCHGAPGFVHSLLSLKPYFASLESRIDTAIEQGRKCIWNEGLLRKEPSLCHGIFGNALCLSPGAQRDHFLAVATPETMSKMQNEDPTLFEPADYNREYPTISGYLFSAAWSWIVCGEDPPGFVFYTDV